MLRKKLNEKMEKYKKTKNDKKRQQGLLDKKCIRAKQLAAQLTLIAGELRALTRETQKLFKSL